MRRSGFWAVFLFMALTGCFRFREPAPKTDEAVLAGDGWARVLPGEWIFQIDEARKPDIGLTAFGEGQGVFRIDLPQGARGATVARLSVAYVSPGPARWSIYPEVNGVPALEPLSSVPVAVEEALAGVPDSDAIWLTHSLPPTHVDGPFYAVFARDGQFPAAEVGAVSGVDTGRLTYREYPDAPSRRVAHLPLVRVYLTDVY